MKKYDFVYNTDEYMNMEFFACLISFDDTNIKDDDQVKLNNVKIIATILGSDMDMNDFYIDFVTVNPLSSLNDAIQKGIKIIFTEF